ncbi:hypothetical protein BT63DRAFT_466487, partial [Microthyrium microscopicum]
GNHLFYANGSQFFVRGVAYQDGGARAVRSSVAKPYIDPLSDISKCERDIPEMIKLGINLIRVYALNASSDHSACMRSFDDVGIYALIELGNGIEDIFQTQRSTWTHVLQDRFEKLVDDFHEYTNVLGFIVASEVVTDRNRTTAMPFVKAAVRDTKTYIKAKGHRNIPVGYTGSDDVAVSKVPSYLVCADVWSTPTIDFYGVSLYGWCGESNLEASGYQRQIQAFQAYPKPVIISEYGCKKPSPRAFKEVSAIYGEKSMTDVFSGAIVYQYYNDSYNSGLINVMGNNVEETLDYTALSSQLALYTPSSTSIGKWPSVTSRSQIPCPTIDSAFFAGTQWPITPNKGICTCMLQSLACAGDPNNVEQTSLDALELLCGESEINPKCAGITGNSTTDMYGTLGTGTIMCSPSERFFFVQNQFYVSQADVAKPPEERCSSLHGTIQSPQATRSVSNACQIVLRQAGPQGTGTITSTP